MRRILWHTWGMPATTETAATLGKRLEARRIAAGEPSFKKLSQRLYNVLGEYTPTDETIRRLHRGDPRTATPDRVDLVLLAAICDQYGCTIRDVSEVAVDRLRMLSDLVVRQSRCSV